MVTTKDVYIIITKLSVLCIRCSKYKCIYYKMSILMAKPNIYGTFSPVYVYYLKCINV